jgi:3-hydroxybutyrate dehydrogenase
MTLHGKTAMVTGSTSGIGLGIAKTLAEQGADIVLNGFGPAAEIAEIQKSLSDAHKVRVIYSDADMSNPTQISTMIDNASRELGHVDILVNNAGIQFTAPVHKFPVDRWDAIIAINLSAVFHATRVVIPQMLERNWGRIINIASAHGLVASEEKSAYVAAKHGVVGFTKVIALETAKTGVTCNAICPGWVLTPLVQKQIDERAQRENMPAGRAKIELLAEKQPSHEFVTSEQLGALTVFLCSEGAAQIRGAAVPVDGGWVAQ